MKELTASNIERQNILNNKYAMERVQEYVGITGMMFEGEYKFTKEMVARFLDVELRTVERYLEKYSDELKHNGYVLIKGKKLKEMKLQFAPVINVGSKKMTHLFWIANKSHCFQDGNKRMAIALCMKFLLNNGYMLKIQIFAEKMESISYQMAAGRIDKDLLYDIIDSILTQDDYSEELKIKIMKAISN